MNHNWTYKKLTDICDIQYGYPFDSSCFSTIPEDGMPLIRIRDVMVGCSNTFYKGDYPKEYTIHKGDYLIGMDGEFNIAPWKSGDALLNQRVCKISSKSNEVSIGYLYRFLTKELKKIEDETPFVTVKHLSAKRLNQVLLPVPSIETQSRIVAELDLLQSIIDKQKAQLKEYDNLAQSIFYDMFGDPVDNDKGWEVKKLGEICLLKVGKAIKASELSDNNAPFLYPCYGGNGIRGYINKYSHTESYPIVGRQGALCGNVNYAEAPFYATEHAVVVKPIKAIDTKWLFFQLKFMRLNQYAHGVAQPGLAVQDLEPLDCVLPPLSLQQTFAAKIESIEKQKAAISKSIAETEKLFEYTMDKYFG